MVPWGSRDQDDPLPARKEAVTRTQLLLNLDLRVSASRIVRQCLLFEFPVLWHFVVVACVGYGSFSLL